MGVTFFLVAVDGDISILLIRIVVVSVVEYLADSFLVLVRVRLAEDRKEKGKRGKRSDLQLLWPLRVFS
jgi:hypothetical protein